MGRTEKEKLTEDLARAELLIQKVQQSIGVTGVATVCRSDEQIDSFTDRATAFSGRPNQSDLAYIDDRKDFEDPATFMNWLTARHRRDDFFGPDLFCDPAWDMLLFIYAASARKRSPMIKEVVGAANVPETTGLRWIEVLKKNRLLEIRRDPDDARRRLVDITPDAKERMSRYLQRWR